MNGVSSNGTVREQIEILIWFQLVLHRTPQPEAFHISASSVSLEGGGGAGIRTHAIKNSVLPSGFNGFSLIPMLCVFLKLLIN